MATINVIDINGKKVGSATLPDELFGTEVNQQLLAQAVRVYLSNQRQATAKTKTRSEINATTSKWYRQKGTGRARHGAKSAPIFVGGGVAHGPSGTQNYSLAMSKQMKRKALACALSLKLSQGEVVVLDGIGKVESRTKAAAKVLQNLSLYGAKSSLIVYQPSENITRSWSNLEKSRLMQAHMLNTYSVLNGGTLIIDKQTLTNLKDIYVGEKSAGKEKSASKEQAVKTTATAKTKTVAEKAEKKPAAKKEVKTTKQTVKSDKPKATIVKKTTSQKTVKKAK